MKLYVHGMEYFSFSAHKHLYSAKIKSPLHPSSLLEREGEALHPSHSAYALLDRWIACACCRMMMAQRLHSSVYFDEHDGM